MRLLPYYFSRESSVFFSKMETYLMECLLVSFTLRRNRPHRIAKARKVDGDQSRAFMHVLKRHTPSVYRDQRADARIIPSIINRRDGDGFAKRGIALQGLAGEWRLWLSGNGNGDGLNRHHGCEMTMATRGDTIHPLTDPLRNQGYALARELVHHPERVVHHTVCQ